MTAFLKSSNKTRTGKIIFLLSATVFLYWLAGFTINVYHLALVSAIFEILWLPVLLMTFCLPILSFIFWVKEKFNLRSFYFYAVLIAIATGFLLYLFFGRKGL